MTKFQTFESKTQHMFHALSKNNQNIYLFILNNFNALIDQLNIKNTFAKKIIFQKHKFFKMLKNEIFF